MIARGEAGGGLKGPTLKKTESSRLRGVSMKQAMEWKWGMGLGILCALALGVLGLQGNSQAFQAVEIPFQNPGGARVAPASAPVSQGGAPGRRLATP